MNKKLKLILSGIILPVVVSSITVLLLSKYLKSTVINYYSENFSRQVSYTGEKNKFSSEGFSDIVKKIQPSTVFIQSVLKNNGIVDKIESGTGIILTPDGYIVTNAHVIKENSEVKIKTFRGNQYNGKIVAIDDQSDIAVLKIDIENSPFIFIQNSNNVEIGDWALAFGNPMKLQNSVSLGIISAKNRNLNLLGPNGIESYLQSDALATSGNSGGPLVNISGEMIGMVSAVNFNNEDYKSFTFAIPSNIVRKIAFDLINFKTVHRAWLGISVNDSENGDRGVNIERVIPDSPASAVNLKKDDTIIKIDSIEIENVPHFQSILCEKKPGDIINVELIRENKKMNKKLALKNFLNTDELISIRKDQILSDYGLALRNLTKNEEDIYKTTGVLVVSVIIRSKAYNCNIEPDYIIEEINGEKVESVDDFIGKIKKSEGKIRLSGIYKNYPGKFPYIMER